MVLLALDFRLDLPALLDPLHLELQRHLADLLALEFRLRLPVLLALLHLELQRHLVVLLALLPQ